MGGRANRLLHYSPGAPGGDTGPATSAFCMEILQAACPHAAFSRLINRLPRRDPKPAARRGPLPPLAISRGLRLQPNESMAY